MQGSATFNDVVGQAPGWSAAVEAVEARWPSLRSSLSAVSPRHLALVGCGSAHHLAEAAAPLWRSSAQWVVTGSPASEIVRDPCGLLPWPDKTVLVAFSRSGTTSETLAAVEAFRAVGGAAVWSVSCRSGGPLAAVSDVAVAIDGGYEPRIAQTRSFSSMLVAAESMARLLGDSPVWSTAGVHAAASRAVEEALEIVDDPELVAVLEHVTRIDVLGSGAGYGIAREAALKLVEISLTASSAFQFPEYRHGPKAMVSETTLVAGVLNPSDAVLGLSVLEEVEDLGGHTLAVASPPGGPLATVMPTFQLLAVRRAEQAGIDPDSPPHLTAVVELLGSDPALQQRETRYDPIG